MDDHSWAFENRPELDQDMRELLVIAAHAFDEWPELLLNRVHGEKDLGGDTVAGFVASELASIRVEKWEGGWDATSQHRALAASLAPDGDRAIERGRARTRHDAYLDEACRRIRTGIEDLQNVLRGLRRSRKR